VPTTLILSGEKNVKKFDLKKRNQRRGGFTLIELVMVVMILAIVAGLAVPVVGWLRRSANYAAQANTTGSLASNLEFFRTTYGNNGYPDNLDSLTLQDGTFITYTDGGFADLFNVGTLTGNEAACFNWLNTIYDHSIDAHSPDDSATDPQVLQGNPSNTAIYPRAFDGTNVAVVDVDQTDEGFELISELYPNAVLDGATNTLTVDGETIKLVGFGLGQGNEAVGRTMTAAPLDPRVETSEQYARYVAIFACYVNREGRRAQLKAIVNAKGRTTNNALTEFWQSINPE
jgi:prepilin-type N-terminal cleavage/methylation domain-containing protein